MNVRYPCLLLRLFLFVNLLSIAKGEAESPISAPRWEDPTVFREGTEVPRVMLLPRTEAGAADVWTQSLNGDWAFQLVGRPDLVPEDFFTPVFDDTSWARLPVPSNWQLHGHGVPLYSNAAYPFHVDPPRVMGTPEEDFTHFPEDFRNPVGLYRRLFSIPGDWEGKTVFLRFGGIDSAAVIWLNGVEIGYVQDSRTPSEFRINEHLKEGANLLAVQVFKFSDGSYLEDQDMWRLSGIFRDVTLAAEPELALRDLEVTTTFSDTTGVLDWMLSISETSMSVAGASVNVSLLSPDGEVIVSSTHELGEDVAPEGDLRGRFEVLDVRPWSAESPTLYTLAFELSVDSEVAPIIYETPIGFRTVELKNGQVLVNGQPVLFKGVNRHDHDPLTGHTVTREAIREDLLTMKRLNFNAVRTSHYPNIPAFYELCDELGFYVICEANIEAHGLGWATNPLAEDPTWLPAMQARVETMVETFKHHPSILFWSMGNESGHGANFVAMADWLHQRDPSRLVHYERAVERNYVDFYSVMYASPDDLRGYVERQEALPPAEQRPAILCEYSHAMGNSSGNLADYWELFRSHRLLQGGFIWDFKDQGLLHVFETEEGPVEGYAYGGDFGDFPNDGSFCLNGVVMPDRQWSPQAWEVKKVQQPVHTSFCAVTSKVIDLEIFNERFFTDLSDLALEWALTRDGRAVAEGAIDSLSIAPQSWGGVSLELPKDVTAPPGEYHLRVSFRLKTATAWSPAGTEIAWDQLALPGSARRVPPPPIAGGPEVVLTKPENGDLVVHDRLFRAVFDAATGQLISYTFEGRERLSAPLSLDFWRAPTNNDRGRKLEKEAAFWREAGRSALATTVETSDAGPTAQLRFSYVFGDDAGDAEVVYTVYPGGAIEVDATVSPEAGGGPEVPRIGMALELPTAFDDWSWFGRGPHENYRDRWASAWEGIHQGNVADLFHLYLDPQESGNRTDIRWSRWSNGIGDALTVRSVGDTLLEVASSPYRVADLEAAKHPHELPASDSVTVFLGYGQTGLAGITSWGSPPLEKYRLLPGETYRFQFRMEFE